MATDLNSNSAVPMLHYGPSMNYDVFKRKMIVACLEKFGNLGRMIQDEGYYEPRDVDQSVYDLVNDPYGIEKSRLLKALEARDKEIRNMEKDQASMMDILNQS
jgi:hypothetical protein